MITISAQTHITCTCGATSKTNSRLGDFGDFKFDNCVFLVFKKRSVISRRKQQSAFNQLSEFDRGRIVVYRDCGLSFRQIVRLAVTDRLVTSRTIAQHIESITHHSVSARTIRRRLQQSGLSARSPLLGLPMTQNHRCLLHQWCDERRMRVVEWNEVVFTDESRNCLQHHVGPIRVWRHRRERMLNSCVMHRHTGPAQGIIVWGGIGYHSRTSLVRIAGILNSLRYISEVLEPVFLPFLQGLVTAIFQQDNVRPHVARIVQMFFVNHHIELFPWPVRSPDLSSIENM
ncbi:transposable element Tc1 transposase [Trichonephila clavipes]|nr:transposable element Tc1 transposase [Trichonephila clavipes]